MAGNEYDDLLQGEVPIAANEYDALAQDMAKENQGGLRLSLSAAASRGVTPERQADILDTAKRRNLPTGLVERNLDAIKRLEAAEPPDLDILADKAPGLAKWMQKPENATLASDDLEPLVKLERATRIVLERQPRPEFDLALGRAISTGWTDLNASAWHLAVLYGKVSPQEAAEAIAKASAKSQELRSRAPDYAKEFSDTMAAEGQDAQRAWRKFVGSYETAKEGRVKDVLQAFSDGALTAGQALDMLRAAVIRPRGLLYATSENLAFSAPSLALGAAGALAGGPAGFAAGSFVGAVPVEIGAWISQAMARRGVDLTNPQAIVAAYADAGFMAEARGEAERKGLTTAAVDSIFNAFAGGALKKAGKGALAKAAAGVKETAVQAVGETVSEAAGQVAAVGVERLDVGEAILEGIVSLGQSAGEAAIGGAARGAFNKNPAIAAEEVLGASEKAMAAQKAAQAMQEAVDAVEASKTTKRLPEAIRQVVAAAAEGADADTVYFQTEAWDAYWQGKGLSPAKAAADIVGDGGVSYHEAKANGTQLELPLPSYIEKVAPTEHYKALLPETRVKPDGMSLTEANEFLKNLPGVMDQLAKEALGVPTQEAPSPQEQAAAKVRESVAGLLLAADTPRPEAERLAQLWEGHFRARAEKLGADPFELYQQMGLDVKRISDEAPPEPGELQPGGPVLQQEGPGSEDRPGAPRPFERRTESWSPSLTSISKNFKSLTGEQPLEHETAEMLREELRKIMAPGVPQETAVSERLSRLDETTAALVDGANDAAKLPDAKRLWIGNLLRREIERRFLLTGEGPSDEVWSAFEKIRTTPRGPLLQSPLAAETFYSKLTRTIEQKMGASATVEQVRALTREIKGEELKWSGIEEYLKGKEKVSKQELLEFLRGNQLEIREETLGRPAIPILEAGPDRDIDFSKLTQQQKKAYGILETNGFLPLVPPEAAMGSEVHFGAPNGEILDRRELADFLQEQAREGVVYENKISEILDAADVFGIGESAARFEQYALPGGQNYREVLFVLPPKPGKAPDLSPIDWRLEEKQLNLETPGGGYRVALTKQWTAFYEGADYKVTYNPHQKKYVIDGGPGYSIQNAHFDSLEAAETFIKKRITEAATKAETFRSPHFSQENILAHTRLTDRVDVNGKRVLFVEEVQSDWHQKGRREGYAPQSTDDIDVKQENEKWVWTTKQGASGDMPIENAGSASAVREFVLRQLRRGVPDAPFRKTWHEFVLKRIIRMAAEGGYDSIAWTTGEQQAERYDLSKQVKAVYYEVIYKADTEGEIDSYRLWALDKDSGRRIEIGDHPAARLPDVVGKELADKIIADQGKPSLPSWFRKTYKEIKPYLAGKDLWETSGKDLEKAGAPGSVVNRFLEAIRDASEEEIESFRSPEAKIIDGLDLKVGGEGMKGFYDGIVPAFLSKFTKKYGAKVGETTILLSGEIPDPGDPHEMPATITDEPTQVHALEITPELRQTAINQGFELFQAAPGEAPRGRLRFGAASGNPRFTIELLAKADRSTFLHESGHVFLENLAQDAAAVSAIPEANRTQAQKQLITDWQTVLDWMEVKDKSGIKREQHEKWARAFEGYLLEGKSPSSALRAAFRRFKAWLVAIYREVNALNIDLSPQIRQVFDRLVATQEEIAQAQAEMQRAPLFADPAGAGLQGPKAEKYLAAIEEARQTAEDEMSVKVLDRVRREEQAWWKEERAALKQDIEAQVKAQKDQIALAALQKGKLPDGSPYPEGLLPPKIDRAAIAPERLKRLPKGVTTTEGGAHPEVLAGMFGFASSEEFLAAVEHAVPYNKLVDMLTDQTMTDRHGDILRDVEALNDEALKAVHTEKQAELLRAEIAHLASDNFAAFKGLAKKITGRVPTIEAVREEAARAIGRRKVRDVRPHLFKVAEAKAARDARDAFLAGDFQAAFDAKNRELINHELYRSAVQAKESVEKAHDRFKKLAQADDRLAKRRDMDLVNAGRAVLSQFGLDRPDKPASEYLEQIKSFDPEMYETVQEIVVAATQNAGNWREISIDDFMAMADTIDSLWDLSLRTRQLEIEGRKVDKQDVVIELATRINEIGLPDSLPGYKRAVTKWEKVQMHLLGVRASIRRVEAWADAMGGPFKRYVWNPISEGVNNYRIAKRETLKEYLELTKQLKGKLTGPPIEAPELGYTFGAGSVPAKAELLHAILHGGNESNLSKLLRGRGWGDVDATGLLDTTRWDAFRRRMEDEGILTKADYDFIQGTWDLLERLKPQAQKAHKDLYGYYFGEIPAKEILTKFGAYRGGYVPAIVDNYIVREADIRAEREALEKSNNSFMFPTSGRGFTKKRVERYAKPLLLDLGLLAGHIDKVLRFVHIEPRVKDVGRVVMDRDFRRSLDALDPAVGGDMLVPWLQRAAQQTIETRSQGLGGRALDTFFRELRRRTGLQIMAANVTNALQQLTGLSIAAVKVPPKHLRNALWTYVRSPKATAESISQKSKFMNTRVTAQVFEVQNQLDELLLDPSKFEQALAFAQKHGYILQAGMQNVVDNITWAGGYEFAIEKGATEAEAVRDADEAVRLTQGSFNPEDVSRFETGTPFIRAFTMFYSYFNMQANLQISEFAKISREIGLRKGAGRALYVYTFGFMIPAVVAEGIVRAMSGKIDEDDDDEYLDDFMAAFFGGQFRTATAMFPGFGPLAQAGLNATDTKWYNDRITTSPAIAMIEGAVVGNVKNVYRAATGEDVSTKKAARDFLTALGLLSGLPLAPLSRPIGYLSDVAEGKTEPAGAVDFIRGLVTGRSPQSK